MALYDAEAFDGVDFGDNSDHGDAEDTGGEADPKRARQSEVLTDRPATVLDLVSTRSVRSYKLSCDTVMSVLCVMSVFT